MKLPKAVTVGNTRYVVQEPSKMRALWRRGEVNHEIRVIRVAKGSNAFPRLYTDQERCETMWHELTHAILHDMDNPLSRDETFVARFSSRLSKAVASAEF